MDKKRSSIDILHDMLSTIADKNGSIKQTHLLYRANLAHQQMKDYLRQLEEKEAIVYVQAGREKRIQLTDEGYKLLVKLVEMRQFKEDLGF